MFPVITCTCLQWRNRMLNPQMKPVVREKYSAAGASGFPLRLRRVLLRLRGVCAVAVAAIAAHHAGASPITISTERRGEMIDIRASAVLHADAATAWRVLTDYNRYPEFIPDLRSSRVTARRGATVMVEQSGDAALWRLHMPIEITFEITEIPPYQLYSRAVAGSLRWLASDYTIHWTSDGLRLDYVGHVIPGWEILGRIEQSVIQQNIARQFQALADEIERSSQAQ